MPNIGNTTEFANYTFSWAEGDGNDNLRGIKITMTEDGTAQSISAWVESGSGNTLIAALYNNSGTLLGYSNSTASVSGGTLVTCTLSNEVSPGDLDLTNSSTYFLGISFSSTQSVANDGGTNTGWTGEMGAGYPVPQSTWGSLVQSQPDYSIYLTYSAGAAVTDVNLLSLTNAAQASLTSLKWSWFDSVLPGSYSAPTDQGTTETTDGSGNITLALPNSVLTSGQEGTLVLSNSAGTLIGAYRLAVD